MPVPEGFVEIKRGKCKSGDYCVCVAGPCSGYENYADGLIGHHIPIKSVNVWKIHRKPPNTEEISKFSHNTRMAVR